MALTKVGKEGITGISNSSDATAITIDSSENVGIGTASPNGNGALTINSATDNSPQIVFTENDTAKWLIGHRHDGDHFRFYDLANSAERLRIQAGGGISFNGDTAAANALDDYEEGAWNPQVGGSATYLSQKGIYTKIGNIVTVHFDIEINAIGTGSNTRITNFPFTANSSGTPLYAGCVSYFSGINSSNTFIGMYVIDGTTECNFTGGTANATTISQNGFAIFGNNARVIGSVTYRTA